MSLTFTDTALDTLLTSTGYVIRREAAVRHSLLKDTLLSLPDRHTLKGSAFRNVVTMHVMQDAMFSFKRHRSLLCWDSTADRRYTGL